MRRKEDGSFNIDEKLDFSRGGRAHVSLQCDKSYDQLLLMRDAISYLNRIASIQNMRVYGIEGPQTSIPVRVERGESARVRFVGFSVEILPKQ